MKVQRIETRTKCLCAFIILSGCAAPTVSPYLKVAQSFQMSANHFPAFSRPIISEKLFVGAGSSRFTRIFNAENRQVGKAPAPDGHFATDENDNFYDVPGSPNNELLILSPPYGHVSTTIGFGNDSAMGVSVDPRNGTFAVIVEAYADGGPGPYYVNFYKSGSAVPCATVQASAAGGAIAGGSFDKNGTAYFVDYGTNGSNGIGSISGECNASALAFNSLPAGINFFTSNMQVNAENHLVFQSGPNIYTFELPKGGRLGQPIANTVIEPPVKRDREFPLFSCLTADGAHLWALFLYSGKVGFSSTDLFEFSYPSGGKPLAKGQ